MEAGWSKIDCVLRVFIIERGQLLEMGLRRVHSRTATVPIIVEKNMKPGNGIETIEPPGLPLVCTLLQLIPGNGINEASDG